MKNGKKQRRILVISLFLLLCIAVSGSLALLLDTTEALKNIFNPSFVTCAVEEEFNGTEKTDVNVRNTGNIDAWIRVKLISYRVDATDSAKRIGGTAVVPEFTPGDGWVENGGFYYYTQPVAPGATPTTDLAASLKLKEYDDMDGGRQVIEVMAEAIQADGFIDGTNTKAVFDAWGVDPSTLTTQTAVPTEPEPTA